MGALTTGTVVVGLVALGTGTTTTCHAWRDHWEEVTDIVSGYSASLEIAFQP